MPLDADETFTGSPVWIARAAASAALRMVSAVEGLDVLAPSLEQWCSSYNLMTTLDFGLLLLRLVVGLEHDRFVLPRPGDARRAILDPAG